MKIYRVINGGAQQFNGREGETATFLSRCLLNSNGLGGGFAPRHLNRSPPRGGRTTISLYRFDLKIESNFRC